MSKKLDPKGKPIGERRVKRALKELGLLKKPAVRKIRTTNSEHKLPRFENLIKDRIATYPDEIWAAGYPPEFAAGICRALWREILQ